MKLYRRMKDGGLNTGIAYLAMEDTLEHFRETHHFTCADVDRWVEWLVLSRLSTKWVNGVWMERFYEYCDDYETPEEL